jgi:hypothetical protein
MRIADPSPSALDALREATMNLHLTLIVAGVLAAASACDTNAQSNPPPKANAHRLQANTTGAKRNDSNDIGQTQQLRLQMQMDRRSKFLETESNIMKKNSNTRQGIIQNMK